MRIYLEDTIPEFRQAMSLESKSNPYTATHALLAITSQKVKEHNYSAVKKCFDIAAKLYDKGNNVVKNAVENVFVYSISNILCSSSDKAGLLSIMPITLYTLYVNQLEKAGY